MEKKIPIPTNELRALRDVWSQSETVDWDSYDKLKARILKVTDDDLSHRVRKGK